MKKRRCEGVPGVVAWRWLVLGTVLLVTATPLVVAPGVLFPYVVGKATFARAVIEVAFGLWLVLRLCESSVRPRELRPWKQGGSWVLAAFALWLVVSAICALAGVSPVRSLWSTYERMQGVVDLAHWFAFVLLAGSVLRGGKDWQLLFTCSLAVGAAVCAWGLIAHYGFFDQPGAGDRLRGALGNPTYLGAYLSINVLIGAGLLARSYRRAGTPPAESGATLIGRNIRRACLRAFWLVAVALGLWALWLTTSRGALIGLGAGALVLLFALLRGRPLRRFAVVIVLLACVGAGGWLALAGHERAAGSDSMLSRVAAIGLDDPSTQRRLAAIGVGLRGFAERPVLGWGAENFVVVWGRYARPGLGLGEHFDHAHNKLVEELATKGLLGFVAYALLWAALARAIYRAVRRGDDGESTLAATVGAALAALFVQNLFLLDSPVTTMQFALLAAFAVCRELRGAPCSAAALPRPSGRVLVRAVAMLVVVALTAATVYAVAYRPFAAARIAGDHVPGTSVAPRASLIGISRAIDAFPPLGNLLRLRMFAAVDMGAMSADDFSRTLAMIEAQGAAAVRAEPQNWRIPAMLALAYRSAATRDPAYWARANEQVERMSALAPGLVADVDGMDTTNRRRRSGAG